MLDKSDGASVVSNLSASTVIKIGSGRVVNACVITTGAVGTLHDCTTTGAATAANQIGVIPAAVGNYSINMPFLTGLVYVPGAAQVVAISYN
jgi:hypothetical protein